MESLTDQSLTHIIYIYVAWSKAATPLRVAGNQTFSSFISRNYVLGYFEDVNSIIFIVAI